MSSRRLHTLLCALVALPLVQAADFTWRNQDRIELDVPQEWEVHGTANDAGGYTLVARPRAEAHALLQVSVLDVPAALVLTDDDLRTRLQDSLRPYVDTSVEKECRLQTLDCAQGHGWYAELTDAALVGQPAKPDDFKVMRSALVLLDARTMVVATMLFDDASAPEPEAMLRLVGGIRVARPAAAASPTL